MRLEKYLVERGKKLLIWKNEHQLRSELRQTTGNRWVNTAGIADARAIIVDQKGNGEELDIEVWGQYYGQMRSAKIQAMLASSRPTLIVIARNQAEAVQRLIPPDCAKKLMIWFID
jgi:hypothetical protein